MWGTCVGHVFDMSATDFDVRGILASSLAYVLGTCFELVWGKELTNTKSVRVAHAPQVHCLPPRC